MAGAVETNADGDSFHGMIWVPTPGSSLRELHRTERLAQDLLTTPFDEIAIQVVDQGEAYYESNLLPKAFGVASGFDPLERLITRLKSDKDRPRRVYVWLRPLEAGNENDAHQPESNHVLTAHPEWMNTLANGQCAADDGALYLEPGLPEVRQHLAGVVGEIVRNYDVDGVYIDGLHEPVGDGEWGRQVDVFTQWLEHDGGETGLKYDPKWQAWRAKQFTGALEAMAEAARAARKDVFVAVGADCMGPAPDTIEDFRQCQVYQVLHQDWPAWRALENIDRLYVRDFWSETSEPESFDKWMGFALATHGAASVSIGVGGFRNESIDALTQIQRVAASGAAGVALKDFSRPVRDIGARDLFYRAVARSVLTGNRRVASLIRPKHTLPTPTPTPALIPKTKPAPKPDGAETTTPGETIVTPSAHEVAAVPDENQLDVPPPPGQGTAGSWDLLPAQAGDDENVLSVAEKLMGMGGDSIPGAMPAATPAPDAPVTREKVLTDLLRDPIFAETASFRFIRPDEKAMIFLRERYPNIF